MSLQHQAAGESPAGNLSPPSKVLGGGFSLPHVDPGQKVVNEPVAKRFHGHGFHVGGLGLLLPAGQISEVSEEMPICRLANTPGWLKGIVNLRGNTVPVFDLGLMFGLEAQATEHRWLLFLHMGDEWVGMFTERLPVRVNLGERERLQRPPALPPLLQPYVVNSYFTDQIWLECDVEGLFGSAADRIRS
jgi:twitching motility protein PilI